MVLSRISNSNSNKTPIIIIITTEEEEEIQEEEEEEMTEEFKEEALLKTQDVDPCLESIVGRTDVVPITGMNVKGKQMGI